MIFREATLADIPQIMVVRMAVRENRLSNPDLVLPYTADYLTRRGKGWVCEVASTIVGFAIADLQDHSIWALFVHPDFAGQGIGKQLHNRMLDWYFGQATHPVWLSTAPGTRAEEFYRRQGWQQTGLTASGEVRFEKSIEK